MRKFIVYTRPLPGHSKNSNTPTLIEVEGEVMTAMENPCLLWLPKGEFQFRITAPDWLHEPQEIKQADGSKAKVMVTSIYHSHSIYDTIHQARAAAQTLIRQEFEFVQRKTGVSFTPEEVRSKYDEITEVLLDI